MLIIRTNTASCANLPQGAHPDAAIGVALAEIAEIPRGANPLSEMANRRTERSVSSCMWISASVLLSHFRGASHSLIGVSLAETAETPAPDARRASCGDHQVSPPAKITHTSANRAGSAGARAALTLKIRSGHSDRRKRQSPVTGAQKFPGADIASPPFPSRQLGHDRAPRASSHHFALAEYN
jgi:hypothetical protein